MKIRRVLITYKKSAYEMYFRRYRDPAVRRLESSGDRGLQHIRRSHEVHYATLNHVKDVLTKKGVPFQTLYRGRAFDDSQFDLVIAIGGDGTFLSAARSVEKSRILGVNSDTSHSVGKLCTADRQNFERIFGAIASGKLRPKRIVRLELRVNGRLRVDRVLNDVLVAHRVPAAMSHYMLRIGARSEQQRSSGLWVATAAGSTGALGSAGGKRELLSSTKLQYRPRELYAAHGTKYALRGAPLPPGAPLRIISLMPEGRVYVDGAHFRFPLRYGEELEVRRSRHPLLSY